MRSRSEVLENLRKLRHHRFPDDQLEWRVSRETSGGKGPGAFILCYLTSRAVQEALDDYFDPDGWQLHQHRVDGGWKAAIGIAVPGEELTKQEGTLEWVFKEGVGVDSEIESLKGGASDAEKRAAVVWGLGRYLYRLPDTWVALLPGWPPRGSTAKLHKGKDRQPYHWIPPLLGGGEAPVTGAAPTGQMRTPPADPGPGPVQPPPPSSPSQDDRGWPPLPGEPGHPGPQQPQPPAAGVGEPMPNPAPAGQRQPAWTVAEGFFAGHKIGARCWGTSCLNLWPCDDHPVCICGGQMWDNRKGKKNPKAPDFKCKNKLCADGNHGKPEGVYWPDTWQKRAGECREQNGVPGPQAPGSPSGAMDDVPF